MPLLGDIPVLGAFFRRTSKQQDKTELLIFITPRIIKEFTDSPLNVRKYRATPPHSGRPQERPVLLDNLEMADGKRNL